MVQQDARLAWRLTQPGERAAPSRTIVTQFQSHRPNSTKPRTRHTESLRKDPAKACCCLQVFEHDHLHKSGGINVFCKRRQRTSKCEYPTLVSAFSGEGGNISGGREGGVGNTGAGLRARAKALGQGAGSWRPGPVSFWSLPFAAVKRQGGGGKTLRQRKKDGALIPRGTGSPAP